MKFCFVAPSIYACLAKDSIHPRVGGAEIQQTAWGHELAKLDINVSYVAMDDSDPDSDDTPDANIFTAFRRTDGVRGLRFLFTRVPGFWRAMSRADADVYYVRGASYLTALAALFARLKNREFIFAGASDADFDPGSLRLSMLRDRWLYQWGLRRANAIVVQSDTQASLLQKNFGLQSRTIPNIIPSIPSETTRDRNIILWVANLRKLKQPLHFVNLAKSFPDEQFVMIGGQIASDPGTYDAVEAAARQCRNLKFLGIQPFSQVEEYFDRAKIFVNTSYSEGFPNTFLQAWCRGVPVVSYIDPDSMISDYELGKAVQDESGLADAIRNLGRWDDARCRRIREYCDTRYRNEPVAAFRDLLSKMRP